MKRLPDVKGVAMVAIGVVVLGSGATYWAYNLCLDAKARYEKLDGELPKEQALREMLAKSQYEVDTYREQLQHLEEGVPTLAYIPTLLTELETLGKQHSITVTGVRPIAQSAVQSKSSDADKKKTGKSKDYKEIGIEFTGRGTYGNVKGMVDSLKKFPKVIAVQTVGLTPKRERTRTGQQQPAVGSPNLEASVRIKAFVFPDESEGQGRDQTSEEETS
jgi:Tfp pilus assembly protein PilO